ncbi:hypothetical protein OG2516_08376 [Oceanicola granulosus HTCC2516]|uniref:Uncharacterized protein n=1 Tax=Oceanicola granulosus (strain ATCC BAA-861 / DSM 15982 / KCTC 12143 / HTCC2516) TaxID=314256 RepID=Q2CBK5_OCEGH|nr:hypothetical protein [Oceanicola granulosus]EAR50040.1 hypothetical protein OG2516_08376 [Oceanicola granulosus HTCC2516]
MLDHLPPRDEQPHPAVRAALAHHDPRLPHPAPEAVADWLAGRMAALARIAPDDAAAIAGWSAAAFGTGCLLFGLRWPVEAIARRAAAHLADDAAGPVADGLRSAAEAAAILERLAGRIGWDEALRGAAFGVLDPAPERIVYAAALIACRRTPDLAHNRAYWDAVRALRAARLASA